MEIKRAAEIRRHGTSWLMQETPITELSITEERKIEIVFKNKFSSGGTYTYTVVLTPDDIGKILAEAMKQSLIK